MQLTKTATDGLLKAIGFMHPEYAPLIKFLMGHEDQLLAVGPIIQAAAAEGPGAFAAAEKAAPALGKAIRAFVAASPPENRPHPENVARMIVGEKPISASELALLDRASPIDDSRAGSG